MSKLTESAIEKAEPTRKTYRLPDGLGLTLEVRPSGAKVFTRFYRFGGRQQQITLGEFPKVRLAEARERSGELTAKIKAGEDPRADDAAYIAKQNRKQGTPNPQLAPVEEERRFETVVRKFIHKRTQEGIAASTLDKLNWNLGRVARDDFNGRDIGSIKPPEILALIERFQEQDKIEKAKDIHRKLAQVFDYAIGLGLVEWNPAKMTTRAVVKRKGGRHPGLTKPKDVGALMRAIRLYPDGAGQNTRAALTLSAYCFLRSNELRGARWGEIDFEKALWTVPAGRMKGHMGDHIVPLARQPLEILGLLNADTGTGIGIGDPEALLFPMPSKPGRYMSEMTLNSALRRLGYNTRTEHCHHGFRTTFSTNMNEQGWNRDWIEAQLAHVDKDGVRSAYNKAVYLEGRREMMQAYANWLDDVARVR